MSFPILSGNVATATAATGYDVANSCRFNDGDSAYLTRDLGTSTAGSGQKFTFSAWVKRGALGTDQYLFSSKVSTHQVDLCFKDDDTLRFRLIYGGTVYGNLRTNAVFRDVSAWYHIVVNMDTTQSTDTNRNKMYVNGSQVTSLGTSTRPNQNSTFTVNNNTVNNQDMSFGRNEDGPGDYFDGYMAEVVWIDGTAYAASDFGEYNEDSPNIWQPKDVSGLTFGTHGVYLDFEDSGDLDDDESGNGNDFTATNLAATDQSTDTCTNNFCTFNSLYNFNVDPTYSEGNCLLTFGSTWGGGKATMAVDKGKWYWEAKLSGTMTNHFHGIQEVNVSGDLTAANPMNLPGGVMFFNQDGGEMRNDGGDTTNDYGTFSDGDIIGIALNMDGGSYGQITIYKNGSAIVSDYDLSSNNDLVAPFTAGGGTMSYNFGGSPSFTISSGNADGNGYGNFEYAVPSGYYALCTKNLAENG